MLPADTASLTGSLGEITFERYHLSMGRLIARPRADVFRVDYVMEWNDQLVKVNVKTMSRQSHKNAFTTTLTVSRGGRRATYFPTDIDFFGVVNLEYDKIWMLPLAATVGKRCLAWVPSELRKYKRKSTFDWDKYQIK